MRSIKNRTCFAHLINKRGYRRAAEVGVFRGKFAAHLLASCPQLFIDCVDAWDGSGMTTAYDGDQTFNEARCLLQKNGENRFRMFRAKSPEATELPAIRQTVYDFVYIDADHSESAVLADIRAWWRLLRVGGIISGHDYNNRGRKRVKKAVDQIFPAVNSTRERCASWWIEKRSASLPGSTLVLDGTVTH